MSADTSPLRTTPSTALPESVTLAATEWFVRLQANQHTDGPARTITQAAWQRWHDADAQHALAWQRLLDFDAHLRTIPARVAHGTLVGARSRANAERRRVLGLLLFAGVAGATWTAADSNAVRAWRADLSTGVGERRTIRLADGTTLDLNTDTAVDLRFSQDTRRLHLVRGEIAITTGADAEHGHRPFFVDTAQGSLQALGTRFDVRQHDDITRVAVLDGAVRVMPIRSSRTPEAAVVLMAGQGATFDAADLRSRFDDAGTANAAAAWTQGMLVVHAMPLGDFLHELGRYRRGHLGCAPEVANLRVSGIYPVDDTDRVLDMLSRALPVEVQRYTRWFVRVQPGTESGESPGRIRTQRSTYQAVGGDRPHT
ncbi:FecR domain-containing protein [Pandoraea pnomenusa]|uniref:FecR domain-containing protein n=1 Tax=Pandoraea pnomenusa TaxID=93220 RepID=UPI0033426958